MRIANIVQLGIKELWGLARDPVMLVLIVYSFTLSIYTAASAQPESLNNAAIAVVDEDQSPVSSRILTAFYPPYFVTPKLVSQYEMDRMQASIPSCSTFRRIFSAIFWRGAPPPSSSISMPLA